MDDKPMTGYQSRFNPQPKGGNKIGYKELEYVELDDDGNPPKDKKTLPFKNLSTIRYKALLDKTFAACHTGRKNFSDRQERHKWNTIERELKNGKMPETWVLNCIEWADSLNKNMIQMLFKNLLTYILNAEKMKDFIAKQKFAEFQSAGEIVAGVVEIEQDHGNVIELE